MERKGFEWVPNKSVARSVWGMLSDYDVLIKRKNGLEKRLIRAYFREYNVPSWVAEKVRDKEWTDNEKAKLINELREFVKE